MSSTVQQSHFKPGSDVAPIEHSEERRAFIEIRDELRARVTDQGLANVWERLTYSERRTVLRSASIIATSDSAGGVEHLLSLPLLEMSRESRAAIRGAITRMSAYASRLEDGSRKHSVPRHAALANLARIELANGDEAETVRLLRLIERCPS